ncbi:TadE family type IV pilus minor pilin [uncultured Amnibacterium sp.]|uniref:TadE family type IV pilus minor pilin n=1 Tax=uncultured Amnibacterium sp. TaxID=1631851 RepID=UPI0035CA37A8
MTAEFAVVLPAVVLIAAALLGGLTAAGRQISVIDAAATAARSLARGDGRAVAERLTVQSGGRLAAVSDTDGLLCATVQTDARVFGSTVLPISARSCALAAALP